MGTGSPVQKVARMRFFGLIIATYLSFFQSLAFADSYPDSVNGNLISEPTLNDYVLAERTPGFSPIVDIIDRDADSVSN